VDAILGDADLNFTSMLSGVAEIDPLAQQSRANGDAITEFQKTGVKLAPIIGEAMCNLEAARGMPSTAQRCEERAVKAANDTLVYWLTNPKWQDTTHSGIPRPSNMPIND
jgi:hypothetical protein